MEAIHLNETVVLVGETGCGKSTQVPQFCLRLGLAKQGRIGITQPRRLAAVSLAQRVSEELSSPLGQKVGYHVRFEKEQSEHTKIVYLTDGMLLREAIHDPLLREYSIVVVDEAHERSLHTDILLNFRDHFLVFLTGREEIDCVAKKLIELNEFFASPIYPVPLYAAMSGTAQLRAFEPPPEETEHL
ncbi:unnamed protein product [Nippostrongylus brasiliensis]|uniref:RNA helicase n=1 Tax=Nippostrongylus brasiliensis TaxID=27835 RepID=A0A0N4YNC3_NIPBR|nr:unnamed protein product [Nippostrongylus brasiliensis]